MMNSSFKRSSHHETNFELQITALIDTLVIILIFLLKSIATESLEDGGAKMLRPPSVNNGYSSGTGNKLSISQDSISWNGVEVFKISELEGSNSEEKWQKLAAIMVQDSKNKEKDTKILLQADKSTPYKIIEKALKIAHHNSFKDIRFVGAKYN